MASLLYAGSTRGGMPSENDGYAVGGKSLPALSVAVLAFSLSGTELKDPLDANQEL